MRRAWSLWANSEDSRNDLHDTDHYQAKDQHREQGHEEADQQPDQSA